MTNDWQSGDENPWSGDPQQPSAPSPPQITPDPPQQGQPNASVALVGVGALVVFGIGLGAAVMFTSIEVEDVHGPTGSADLQPVKLPQDSALIRQVPPDCRFEDGVINCPFGLTEGSDVSAWVHDGVWFQNRNEWCVSRSSLLYCP